MTNEQKIELENLNLQYHQKHLEILRIEEKLIPLRILEVEDILSKLPPKH